MDLLKFAPDIVQALYCIQQNAGKTYEECNKHDTCEGCPYNTAFLDDMTFAGDDELIAYVTKLAADLISLYQADPQTAYLAATAGISIAEADKPLTAEQLSHMEGKPYYHVSLQGGKHEWVVLDPFVAKCPKDYHYGERWLAYLCPPASVTVFESTHADQIRSMTDAQMEDFIRNIKVGKEPWCDHHCKMAGDDNCNDCLQKWLKQPIKEKEK